MNAEMVLEKLMEAGFSVWLDEEGKLRIDKDTPAELKELVRQHKQALIDVRTAQAIMNSPGMKILRLPQGHLAVAHPLGADLDEIRWAMQILGMEPMPLVINDEGYRWVSYEEWRLRQPVWTKEDRERYHREREAREQEQLKRRKRIA